MKLLNGGKDPKNAKRYRCQLSDGMYSTVTMLATQLNDLVDRGDVQRFTVVRVADLICNEVQGRK